MSWVTKVKNFVESEFGEDFRGALQWAAEQDGVISESDINKSFGENAVHLDDRIEDIMVKNRQLYSLLCCTTGQQGVAGTLIHHVIGCSWNNGFEAWRMLHRRYYPSSYGHQKVMLKALIRPDRADYEHLAGALER